MEDEYELAKEQAKARHAADRAEAEIWYLDAIQGAKTQADHDDILVQLALRLCFSHTRHMLKLGSEWKRPITKIQEAIEKAPSIAATEVFKSKHYYAHNAASNMFLRGFTRQVVDAAHVSDEWRALHEKLKELAEQQSKPGQIAVVTAMKPAKKSTGRRPGEQVNSMKVRELRGDLSQERFAQECAVSISAIQRGENGGRWDEKTFIKVFENAKALTGKTFTLEDLKITSKSASKRQK